ncbi:MAG TPA: hypothetical protein GXX19_00620 [Syntrophomonadaceae bacterium]|nr:hypothetical protein [Syntrophomonadaceae bacterium]
MIRLTKIITIGLLILVLSTPAGCTGEADLKQTGTAKTIDVKQIENDIKNINSGFLNKPISIEEAEKILGKHPISKTMPELFNQNRPEAEPLRLLNGTLYRADLSDISWIVQLWYRNGDPPAYIMIRQKQFKPGDEELISGHRTIKLDNGVTAAIWFNHIREDGKPLEPEWVKGLWHLYWIRNGITYTIDAVNIDWNELLLVAHLTG